MVYNDTTNLLGIIQAEEDYCELGNAGISGDATLLKQFTRHNNTTLSKIWHWIFQSAGDWKYDDSNETDLPQATQNITSGTGKYALPTGALAVTSVEYLPSSGAAWVKLTPISDNDWEIIEAQGNFCKDSGSPGSYKIVGDTIEMDYLPTTSVTNGLKVYFSRGSVAFAYDDTTETPGFASEYHNAVAVGGALEWLKVHKPNSSVLTMLQGDWLNYEKAIKGFYNSRFKDLTPRITMAKVNFL